MVNKKLTKTIIATGLTSALLISGCGILYKQQAEIDKLERRVEIQQSSIINYKHKVSDKQLTIDEQIKLIQEKDIEIEQLRNDNANLQEQLNEATTHGYRTYEVTFYTVGYESTQKQKGQIGYGITASGTVATVGQTIAAPPEIPFGTKVYIEGIGVRIVEDRGSAIKNNVLDVLVGSEEEAKQLGRQNLKVYILE